MRLHHHDFSNGKSWETSSGGMSSCKCNIISACVAFIAQSVAAALVYEGIFPSGIFGGGESKRLAD